MKRLILALLLVSLIPLQLFSQDRLRMNPADRLIFGLFTDIWSGLPEDMNQATINRGVTIDYLQDFPIGTSNFSFAAGLGFSGHNLYSDHLYVRFNSTHEFQPMVDGIDYRTNKLSLNYLNIPVELRFRTQNMQRNIRIHAGVKAGVLINGHTKYVGDDPGEPSRTIRLKEGRLDNIETFLVGAHARLGYGRFNLYTYIPLTSVFEGNEVENANFISVGLSFVLF